MGITPSNNPGTEMELLPYMAGNSPALPYLVMGNPTGHGIQFQTWKYCFSYICQRSAQGKQSLRPSDIKLSLEACLKSMAAQVKQCKITTMWILILWRIFDRYNHNKKKWPGFCRS